MLASFFHEFDSPSEFDAFLKSESIILSFLAFFYFEWFSNVRQNIVATTKNIPPKPMLHIVELIV